MQKIPAPFRLMRMHQPVGVWLVYWPCVWAILLASLQQPDLPPYTAILFIALFFLGALATRSGGCIVNDLADRDFDRQVARTKTRPLASGEMTVKQAFCWLALCCAAALAVLCTLLFSLPAPATALKLLWITLPAVALIVAYPFMKRITWWPQAFLGLTFNWGALMGWVAISGEIAASALWLYAGSFFWTLGYDTIYGHQDKRDDEKIGVKSTSRHLEKHGHLWIGGFYVAFALCLLMACWPLMPQHAALATATLAAAHGLWQLHRWQPNNPANCMAIFRSNVGAGLAIALWLGYVCWAIA